MDALKLLKADHQKVQEMFDKVDELTDRAQKTRKLLVDKICEELTIHAMVEEKIFYPSVRAVDEEVGKMVLESFEEHALVKRLVAELERMDGSEERFMAKATVLKELVEHHVKEEERDLFPKVKKAMEKEQLEALGERMEEMKLRMQHGKAMEMDRPRRRAGNGASHAAR